MFGMRVGLTALIAETVGDDSHRTAQRRTKIMHEGRERLIALLAASGPCPGAVPAGLEPWDACTAGDGNPSRSRWPSAIRGPGILPGDSCRPRSSASRRMAGRWRLDRAACRATRERAWKSARTAASAEDAAVARHEYWRVAAARRSRTGLARGVPPATAATAR